LLFVVGSAKVSGYSYLPNKMLKMCGNVCPAGIRKALKALSIKHYGLENYFLQMLKFLAPVRSKRLKWSCLATKSRVLFIKKG
ncbi:MAG: hypothetical protein V4561_12940, partial [Bacteroidota bacterium]